LSGTDVEEIEGRLKQIVTALEQKNVHLLPGGTLERYLPLYAGDHYELMEDAKRQAVVAEIEEMAKAMTAAELSTRYGELYQAVCGLPSKSSVDVEPVLRNYLSQYIHDLQAAVVNNPTWMLDQVQSHLNRVQRATTKVFSVQEFNKSDDEDKEFSAIVVIAEMLGEKGRLVRVDHQTNAGMGDFEIEFA